MKKKRVLITGANGFTGSYLCQELEVVGWEVIPMVQKAVGCRGEVVADFCDQDFMDKLYRIKPVDAVVHLAARIGWYGGSRADLFQPNVWAVAQLVQWAQEQNCGHFVFASAALIGGERNTFITAETGMNTENDYLYSKWLGEEIIKMSGINSTLLRISGIFGKNGPPHLGINKAIGAACAGKPPVLIGKGVIKRNYVYVQDLCEIISYCLDKKVLGTHLVGGVEPISIRDMLGIICEILLPGQSPVVQEGPDGYDQVVERSPMLPGGRSFRTAIIDIKENS